MAQLLGRIAIVTFVAFTATVAVIYSRRDDEAGVIAPLRREEVDALSEELARCRTVTPDETASLENCRQMWAEKRRQFFRPTKTPPSLAAPTTPSNGQSRAIQVQRN